MDLQKTIENIFMQDIKLDKNSLDQLHLQVANSISRSIVRHRIKAGTALPYEIWIAEKYRLNRNTVHKAYEKLISDGFAEKIPGRKGIVVSDDAKKKYMSPFPAIGIVTSGNFTDFLDKSSQTNLGYFSGVIDRANDTKHSSIFLHLPNAEEKEEKIQQWIEDTVPRLSGIVHLGRGASEKGLAMRILLEHKQIPQVLISGFSTMQHISSVYGDVHCGGMSAGELLRNKGHRKIGILSTFINNKKDGLFNYCASERVRIMTECFRKCNLRVEPEWISISAPKEEGIYRENIRRILDMKEHPTAFWCQNDYNAFDAIKIFNDLGLDVPGDISIIGFDDVRECASGNPPLTTIRQPCYSIGRQTVDLIIDLFENGIPGDARNVKVPTELVVRDSVGRVRSNR